MKKLFLLLVMTFGIVATAFADDYAYVSNVQHYSDRTVVTISAKGNSLSQYPDGFMVGVRPANKIFDLFLTTSRNEKTVRLTPEEPSSEVIFWCDEDNTSKKACTRDDFVVDSKL
ncbi:MAG: hypothetical protein IJE73_03240 [Muribaculaceae bacterium]|nr:hypothetical protein [Muribaculaceae bacterium]